MEKRPIDLQAEFQNTPHSNLESGQEKQEQVTQELEEILASNARQVAWADDERWQREQLTARYLEMEQKLEEAERERDLAMQAQHQAERTNRLTELPNRLALDEHLAQLIEKVRGFTAESGNEMREHEPERRQGKKSKFVVLFVDGKAFKSINDMYGHAVGDRTIIEAGTHLGEQAGAFVGDTFRVMIRKTDFLAHISGDEFVMVLDETTAEEVTKMFPNSIKPLEFAAGAYAITLGFNVGAYEYRDGDTVEQIFDRSNLAMRASKGNPADIAYYDDSLEERREELMSQPRS